MAELRSQAGVAALALQFTILTAARTGEAIGATWAELDLDAACWTVPGERMKAGREHRVPLSDAAVAVLRQSARLQPTGTPAPGAFVFPGGKVGKPLSNMAMLALLRRIGRGDLTAHGFRSTFRDWAAEQTTYPREVAEARAGAHAARQGGSRLPPRRPVREAPAPVGRLGRALCRSPPSARQAKGKVVPIRAADAA